MHAKSQGELFERPAATAPAIEGSVLQDLLSVLGEDGLLRLLEQYGGVRLYMPRRMPPKHPLAQRLGWETAQALCQFACSGELRVPTGRHWRARARHAQIHALRAQGMSLRELARRFLLSERHICRVLKQRKWR